MNILKWFGWQETEFDESRRLFLRKGATVVLAPIVVPKVITYFLPQETAFDISPGEALFFLSQQPLYNLIDTRVLEEMRYTYIYNSFYKTTPFISLLKKSGQEDNLQSLDS